VEEIDSGLHAVVGRIDCSRYLASYVALGSRPVCSKMPLADYCAIHRAHSSRSRPRGISLSQTHTHKTYTQNNTVIIVSICQIIEKIVFLPECI